MHPNTSLTSLNFCLPLDLGLVNSSLIWYFSNAFKHRFWIYCPVLAILSNAGVRTGPCILWIQKYFAFVAFNTIDFILYCAYVPYPTSIRMLRSGLIHVAPVPAQNNYFLNCTNQSFLMPLLIIHVKISLF